MRQNGLTVLEVIVAIAIIGIVLAILSSVVVRSAQSDRTSGQRTQAVQLINLVGRQIIQGNNNLLPQNQGAALSWDYTELTNVLTQLPNDSSITDLTDPDLYRLEVTHVGTLSLDAVSFIEYDYEVCWQDIGAERCVSSVVMGPPFDAGSINTGAPVVN